MVKKIVSIFLLIVFVQTGLAGVIKESKTEVRFKGFGTFKSESIVKTSDLKRMENSTNEFKGKGFFTNMAAKLFMNSEDEAQITDLDKMQLIMIDHKKKEYQIMPLQMEFEDYESTTETYEEEEYDDPQTTQEQESDIRIIRQEFKVNDTNQEKTINDFPVRLYTIMWVTVWENINTGKQGTDSMFTKVWTTKQTDRIEKARKEEMNFSKSYMEKAGIPVSQEYY
ncbi:MAG: hypothetical protein GF313_00955, partial [Caldithrix sp.]|nr:hypothetical protein [Caldithrix sp.]